MTDWRSGLSWVPIVVFSVLLLASFVVGLAGGYKRVLYWTGGNLALWLIAFIITAAGGDSIASSLAKLIKEKVSASEIQEMSNKELTDAVRMYLGLGIYILAAIVGNLLILLPMYFGGYVKWCKIGKYDPRSKKYDKYVAKVALKNKNKAERLKKAKTKIKMSNKGYFWLSRGIAMPLSVVLGLPMVATATQLAFGGTVQTSSMLTASGKNKNLKGLYEFTSWITDNIGKHYVDGLADNSSAIISGINLGINDDANLEDLFNKIKDCMDSVDDVGDSLDEAKLESIEATFTNYAVYANDHRSKFEPWLKDLSYSKKTLDIVRSLINSFIEPEEEPAVTEENFSNIQVFIDGVLNGCWVNTVEGTDPITLGNYEFDWYTNPETAAVFKRLALDP
ncbi:MAG: hypothetical protein HUJ52_03100, partial [Malacoplasma sp.]|nr:hypothetical protein [Malacoplasma sp.]